MNSKIFKLFLVVVCLLAGAGVGVLFFKQTNRQPGTPPPISPVYPPAPLPLPPNPSPSTPTSTPQLPKTFSLKIPFTPQAPTANWDEIHNEACEEASAIMVYKYFSGDTRANLPAEEVETEISKLVEWEKNTFGYFLDINSEETVRLIKEVYGLNAKIIYDVTEKNIKEELVQNHAVILPANGQMLGNPNFRRPGPPYHMLVIKGYDQSGFITNDPGTRKGLNYPYTYDTLYAANGDFNHDTHSVDTSKKMLIVVWK